MLQQDGYDMAFTENWIQSLTLAAKVPAALGANNPQSDRVASAGRLWDFAKQERLLSLLDVIPSQNRTWVFEDDEAFIFESEPRLNVADKDDWMRAIGVVAGEFPLVATISREDWYTMIRRQMVGHGRSFSASALPEGTTLKLKCIGHWDTARWSMKFESPAWMSVEYESPFHTQRPDWSQIEDKVTMSIIETIDALKLKSTVSNTQYVDDTSWIQSIESLRSFHESILIKNNLGASPLFRRVWAAVWQVIYRQENKLKGDSDLGRLRKELEFAFQNGPRMTLWLFVLAKLTCKMQRGGGLGACGEFRDLD
jgi:hypothetical protein